MDNEGPLDEHLAESIELDEYTPLDPGWLEQSRGDTNDYKWIPREDVVKLWQPENIPSPRLRPELLFKLMWFTSCRCATLANAEIYPDNPDRGLNCEKGYIRVKTLKRGDSQDSHRKVYYPKDRIEPLLQQWLDQSERRASSPYATESSHLFVTRQKKRIRPSYISRLVKRAAFNVNENADSPEEKVQEVTGYDVHGNPQWLVTGHTIRHSSLTHLANHTDMDLHMVKKQAGHAKYETTLKYVHDEPDARRRAVNEAWQ